MTDNTNYSNTVQSNTLAQVVDSAFAKGLASVIMAEFPIASIIAIFMGKKASSLVAEAERLAEQTGLSAGGKKVAAKIMGKIGFIAGIVLSVFWAFFGVFYFFYILFIIMMATA